MKVNEGRLAGVRWIKLEPHRDARGFLTRTYCKDTFEAEGLNTAWPQCNLTETILQGAIRGMHWQAGQHGEVKLIRCEDGAVWDCLVDVRRNSPTFGKWESFELTPDNGMSVYVPVGIAHGFQTLAPNSRLFYMMSARYVPESAQGLRWDDPDVAIFMAP